MGSLSLSMPLLKLSHRQTDNGRQDSRLSDNRYCVVWRVDIEVSVNVGIKADAE